MSHGNPMTRRQAQMLCEAAERFMPGAEIHPCGSFRRGKETVGDLDIAVVVDDAEQDFEKMVSAFCAGVGGVIERGGDKMAVCNVHGFQVDFYRTERRHLGAMQLFLTGSAEYGRKVRAAAKRYGMKLNQYGLWREGISLPLASREEEHITTVLGLEWVAPEAR